MSCLLKAEAKVESFLSGLAVEWNVAVATQNQAMNDDDLQPYFKLGRPWGDKPIGELGGVIPLPPFLLPHSDHLTNPSSASHSSIIEPLSSNFYAFGF
ncbi:hypothetical protein NOC27_710 [Nitrosococcus oceani AFC27]|nr:hypothetical protein [Nitrosococcus oceani]EDZ67383.1 hypothetical protein NOC27_710 [Nitrosococcus oceani AFC27]